jgi:FlaA1/EpsC-like NDP-sugar epimerase
MRLRNRYLLLADIILVALACLASFAIRFDTLLVWQHIVDWWLLFPLALFTRPLVNYGFGLYRRMWQYASVGDLLAIAGAVLTGSLVMAALAFGLFVPLGVARGFSRGLLVIELLLSLLLLGGIRFFFRFLRDMRHREWAFGNAAGSRAVLIAGAGDAGAMIVREMQNNPQINLYPVGFVDDDQGKVGQYIHGVRVLGTREEMPELLRRESVDEVIIAMPTAPGAAIRNIADICEKAGLECRTLPGLFELLDGKISVQQIRKIQLEDLLRREPTQDDLGEAAGYLDGAAVMVTGAGGSIGAELCRQIARHNPRQLVLLGHGENSIFHLDRELTRRFPDLNKVAVIGDIRDAGRIAHIFALYNPTVVFHSAAHKHVPLMELNVDEAITNNILGTRNLIQAAQSQSVERFVLISTDKAVHPSNVMGASKRVAEMLIQAANHDGDGRAKFVAVRFGNVLGSRGSLVPILQEQIAAGGPITLTHPEATRYFMTLPEAVQLVIQAAAMGQGGEIFVLDMGEPIKIVDLAADLVELSGMKLGLDIDVSFVGLRPGEKLHERLFADHEEKIATPHAKIYCVKPGEAPGREALDRQVDELVRLARLAEEDEIRAKLKELIPDFEPTDCRLEEGF